MEMTTERSAGVLSLGVQGRIDGDSVAHFEQAVEAAIAADDRAVVLDLGALDYLSSAGLRAILLIAKTLWEQDGYFALCSVSDHVREVFEISGFDRIIAIHPSAERRPLPRASCSSPTPLPPCGATRWPLSSPSDVVATKTW